MGKLLRKGGIALLILLMAAVVTGCAGALPDAGWAAFNADPSLVYAGIAGKFTGLDAGSGTQKWTFLPQDAKSLGGFYGTPAVTGNVVVSGATTPSGRTAADTVYAVEVSADRSSVRQLWSFKAGDLIVGGPTVSEGTVYVTSADGNVYALDLQTGQKRWSFAANGPVWSGVVREGDRLFFGSMGGTVNRQTEHFVYALDLDGGQVWRFATAGAVPGTPAVGNGLVYVGDVDSNLYAIDAQTGVQRWRFDGARGWFWGTPVVANGTVYAASLDHNVYALDANTGQVQWTFDAKGPMRAGPTLAGGTMYVATESQHLFAVDVATHAQLWDFASKGALLTPPVAVHHDVLGDVVYVTTSGGIVYAVNAKTGTQVWVYPPPK